MDIIKKQYVLFSLLMPIAMMVMCPTKMWAKEDNRLSFLELCDGVTATITDEGNPWERVESESGSVLRSTNYGIPSSASTITINITATKDFNLKFKVSCIARLYTDFCEIQVDNVTAAWINKNDDDDAEYYYDALMSAGNHSVRLSYTKGNYGSESDDRAFLHYFRTKTGCVTHKWVDKTPIDDDDVVEEDPTCTDYGFKMQICSECSKVRRLDIPPLGHAFVEDAANKRVKCSRYDCSFTAPMLTECLNTGLTYGENGSTDFSSAGCYSSMYYFKAKGTGTLTITDSDDHGNEDNTYGALFNANMSTLLTSNGAENVTGNCFRLTYNVTEGQGYWIGARAYNKNTKLTGHSLTITVPVETQTLTDGVTYDGSMAYQQAATLTYKRTFVDNDWNCLYVPFEAPVSSFTDCSIYAVNMFQQHDTDNDGVVDNVTLEVIKAPEGATIIANHPYLIKYNGTDAGTQQAFTFHDVTLATAATPEYKCSSMNTDFVFKGMYTNDAPSATEYYTLVYDETQKKVVLGTSTDGVGAQRWYMTKEARNSQFGTASNSSNNAKSISIVIAGEDEDTTGINSINNEKIIMKNCKFIENGMVVIMRNGRKYNLNGQVIK